MAARRDIALIKFFGAKVLHDVIDRALQAHGALGYSTDLPLEAMYRYARAARFYDGPDEVHRASVARQILRGLRGARRRRADASTSRPVGRGPASASPTSSRPSRRTTEGSARGTGAASSSSCSPSRSCSRPDSSPGSRWAPRCPEPSSAGPPARTTAGTRAYTGTRWPTRPRSCCSPRRAGTAPASIAPCRRSSARSSCTARRSTCARRSSTTSTSSSSCANAARCSSRSRDRGPRGRDGRCSPRTASPRRPRERGPARAPARSTPPARS